MSAQTHTEPVRLLVNGEARTVTGAHPARTVLRYLREDLRLTGTKEGCAEGDCGACTVVVGELDGDAVRLRPINACIRFLPTLHGKALYTVEGLRRADGSLHPVQQAMVDCHGSQCGFCTPGFVMSLWSVYVGHQRLGRSAEPAELRTALSGNLCRCTGYRSILEAGRAMFDLPPVSFDCDDLRARLSVLRSDATFHYRADGTSFFAPRTLRELCRLRAGRPRATLLAGCTDIGLWVNKQLTDLGDMIWLGEVNELKGIEAGPDGLRIGAAVPLSDGYRALVAHFPDAHEQWERFASVPIRNAGTLAGNIANGSPIGDSMPWLIAVGARVVLYSVDGSRTLPLEDFYLDYMRNALRPAEIVGYLDVPLPKPGQHLRTYKLAKRFDSDISAVCAAFRIRLDADRIVDARVAFGGMAAVPKRARACEAALAGQSWSEATARAAMAALERDYQPISDMRASAANRMASARNLFYRFWLETRPGAPLPADAVRVFAAA